MSLSEEIKVALQRGMQGFSIPGVAGISDVLLNVDTMTHAQRWLITLNAWNYRTGSLFTAGGYIPVGGAPFDGILPDPDNQIESALPNYKAILTWGCGGTSESAVIDYPTRGVTISVTAASVRLQIQGSGLSGGVLLPKGYLSGMIAPSDVSRDSVIQPPTFTSAQRTLNNAGVAGSTYISIPARACGYRPFLPGALTTYYNVGQNLYQLDSLGNRLKLDILNWGGTSAPVAEPSAALISNSQGWYPLLPTAQVIEVNTASTTQQQIILQFVLDIA